MSDKLEALAEEDEMKEDYGQSEMDAMDDEISLEELLAELDGLEEGNNDEDEDDFDPSHDIENAQQNIERGLYEAESDDEVGTISVDELKDIIRDIMSDVMGGEGEEEEGEEEEGEEEMSSEDDLELEEILAEIASLEEGDDEIEEGLKDFAQKVGDKVKATVGDGGKMDKFIDKTYNKMKKAGVTSPYGGQKVFEEGDDEIEEGLKDFAQKVGDKVKATVGTGGKMDQFIDRTHAKMKKAGVTSPYGGQKVFEEAEELDEMGNSTMREPSDSAAAGLDNIISGLKKLVAKGGPIAAKAKAALADLGSAAGAAMRAEATELDEAMNTIATLRSELNEVNLLNAKLLYVNKLFKAKNLNESQKVKVINAFDRAETVREAKNVYDTLNESLNAEKAKSQIKESLSFASKSAGVGPNRQPIVEGNDFVARMQKLAGII
jgi:transcriptional regulator